MSRYLVQTFYEKKKKRLFVVLLEYVELGMRGREVDSTSKGILWHETNTEYNRVNVKSNFILF